MCFVLRRAKMYDDKMETLLKKIDDDGTKAQLVAVIGKIEAPKRKAPAYYHNHFYSHDMLLFGSYLYNR